jgi:uncharacterized protein (DUF1697 family)
MVALLRGINVNPSTAVDMAELRAIVEDAGYDDVRTLLRSGNVLFSARVKADVAATRIEAALARRLTFAPRVLVRTAAELEEVVQRNPLRTIAQDPSRHVVSFLSAAPAPATLREIDPGPLLPDEFRVIDREIYMWMPNGTVRSPLPKALSEKRLGVILSARNWNTVTKLVAMTRE